MFRPLTNSTSFLYSRLANLLNYNFNSSLNLTKSSLYATMSDQGYVTVSYVTAPSEQAARDLARSLVENRLAACVNLVKDVESIYEWKGQLNMDQEVLMIIKSHSKKSTDIIDHVKKNIPYDCPEVVTMRVDSGNEDYLKWVHESIEKKPFVDERSDK